MTSSATCKDESCSTTAVAAMTVAEAIARAKALKAVADPVRLRLLDIIGGNVDQEACVCQLTESVSLSQSTVSHHLKTLVDAGILEREQRGTWAWYSLVPGRIDDIAGYLTPQRPDGDATARPPVRVARSQA